MNYHSGAFDPVFPTRPPLPPGPPPPRRWSFSRCIFCLYPLTPTGEFPGDKSSLKCGMCGTIYPAERNP